MLASSEGVDIPNNRMIRTAKREVRSPARLRRMIYAVAVMRTGMRRRPKS